MLIIRCVFVGRYAADLEIEFFRAREGEQDIRQDIDSRSLHFHGRN